MDVAGISSREDPLSQEGRREDIGYTFEFKLFNTV
jgi:hypothetical protein